MKLKDMQIISECKENNIRKIKPNYPEKKLIDTGAFASVYEVQHFRPGTYALKQIQQDKFEKIC